MAPRQPYAWRKKWDLVSLRNVKSEEQARVSSGRLFHARAAATGKARSPRVARRVDGTAVFKRCRRTKVSAIDKLTFRLIRALPEALWRNLLSTFHCCWVLTAGGVGDTVRSDWSCWANSCTSNQRDCHVSFVRQVGPVAPRSADQT